MWHGTARSPTPRMRGTCTAQHPGQAANQLWHDRHPPASGGHRQPPVKAAHKAGRSLDISMGQCTHPDCRPQKVHDGKRLRLRDCRNHCVAEILQAHVRAMLEAGIDATVGRKEGRQLSKGHAVAEHA
eukprot:365661-Chlamydomonas_euryale.AAC.10